MKERYNIVDRAGKEGIEKGERIKETRGKEWIIKEEQRVKHMCRE